MTGVLAQNGFDWGAAGDVVLLLGGFVLYGVVMFAMVLATVNILRKAGYSGWWSLVLLVPILNMVMYVWFALADWPALRGRHSPYLESEPAYSPASGERTPPRLT